ncbi:unnamed protein product [Rotaria sordida]|uniref:Uncharacterized protein n=1 Tax=Rotaria sordida TaxID=392033 RepID=A0A814U663_9BILA|nr:unnamed protein product [Rotaria sordida]CAF1424145.1 unnamed protein product [Rotaria sordida]
MVPVLPVIQSYAQFGYWTNITIIYGSFGRIPLPDFVCYDIQRCPFPPDFQINNLTCLHLTDIGSIDINYMIIPFHMCSPLYESGNETHCFDRSLFHCPNTTKCISKHRLLDGIADCLNGSDETYTQSCHLNHPYRFRCPSENKCLSPVLMRDSKEHCRHGEDERYSYKQKLPYQNLCDGYTHLPAAHTDRENETDETNCEQWPCNNQYTQCDMAWTCPNGADQINCNPTSKCYPDHHECVSPITFKVICLPMNDTGNDG